MDLFSEKKKKFTRLLEPSRQPDPYKTKACSWKKENENLQLCWSIWTIWLSPETTIFFFFFIISNKRKFISMLSYERASKVDRIDEWLFLCQKKYTRDMFKKFNLLERKQISTSMEINAKICAHEGKELNGETTCWQLIGSLIYITSTWSDISYAVGVMTYMQSPKKPNLDAARWILR